VLTAETAREAFTLLKTEKVDCLICDVMMPGMSGGDFVNRLRSIDNFEYLPVIMLTSAGADLELELITQGADLFCPKNEASNLLMHQLDLLLL